MAQSESTASSLYESRFGLPLPPLPMAGFIAAVVAVLLMSFLSYTTLHSREEAAAASTHAVEAVDLLQSILSALQDAETGQRGYLLTGDEEYLAPYTSAKASLAAVMKNARSTLRDPHQQQQLDVLQELANAKMAELAETVALRSSGKMDSALSVVNSDRGKILMDRIRAIVVQMRDDERVLLDAHQERWQRAVNASVTVVWAGSGLLLVLIFGSAAVTARDYRARQIQSWLRNGQVGLNSRLQGGQRLDTLAENVLGFLSEYLEAPVGAVYVAARNGHFHRIAGHALALNTGETLHSGDGLLGQAAKERRALHVREVPAEHLPVASATGKSQPRELMIVPAVVDGSVQAVIELGFFKHIAPEEREFLERVGEMLGVAVRASKDQTRLEELLEETQRQAEELQTQQEELRVSNEELESQANVLKESQARLETQQAELEQTNSQLEEHAQMLGRQNDELDAARRELVARAEELSRSNQFKSEFLANMSHELRTPLNSSLILAKLLSDNPQGNLTEEQVKFASNIYSAGNDLLELINDILDLSKIEARKVELTRETINVAQLLDGLEQTFQPLAEQKNISLDVTVDDSLPDLIHTDSQRLRQVLRNLLSNALKFTSLGGVSLRVSAPRGAQGEAWIRFDVIDTGIGIPPEQHDIIFEPFRQADGTTNRRYGGTGLGLSISRELAALLGGSIELASTPGKGSTFSLLIPQQLPARATTEAERDRRAPSPAVAQTTPRANAPARRAARVKPIATNTPLGSERVLLIIEDDAGFADTLCELGRSLKYECVIALTADEGIDLALRYKPAAIVLDIHLPDHTGLSVLDRLKHNPATRHIPIQVISGHDYDQAALEMGAANVLRKPVDRDKLIDALQTLELKTLSGERLVLIVEDNTVQRDSICRLLESGSVKAIAVSSAAQALEQLRTRTFDCMVLDLALPDASGYELLERMAGDDSYSFPPVIVYTARSLSQAEEQQLRRYSKSIIIKGAKSPERLLDEVTLFLHKVESSLPAEHQRMLRLARSRDSIFERRVILLAEDDVRNVFAISRVLEPHGAKLEIARNGREALDVLERNPGIDLVLMDIMMPEMDGLEAMERIREQKALATLPIIALTAKAMPDDRQRCLEAGANDYITKPIDVEKLLSLLRIWLPPRSAAAD